jgi:hypothetical protein
LHYYETIILIVWGFDFKFHKGSNQVSFFWSGCPDFLLYGNGPEYFTEGFAHHNDWRMSSVGPNFLVDSQTMFIT